MDTHAHISSSHEVAVERHDSRGLAIVMLDLDRPRSAEVALRRAADLTTNLDLLVIGRIAGHRRIAVAHRDLLRNLLYETTSHLPDDVAIEAEIRIGDRYSVALAVASEHRATLFVFGASRATGTNLVAIADELATPVLVAREPRPGRVVAASDARLELTPVLGAARRILGDSCSSITLFHAATPQCRHVRYEAASHDGLTFDRVTCERLLALQHLVPESPDVRVRVDADADPVHAILDFAERRAVDVLTIGYRQRPAVGPVRRHTTARVIDGCDCSVLIVPIGRGFEA